MFKGSEKELKKALELMRHRGGDFSQIKKFGEWVVGHNLHAMVNFHPQPFCEGDFWFAGNLEIYNWKELAKRYKIDAENDADLAFKLMMKKGEKALENFDGPFAVSFFNGDFLILARDLSGIFPLFYRTKNFAFASERKAFFGLRELHPRHRIYFQEGEFFERWIKFKPKIKEISEEKAVKVLNDLLKKAVKKRACENLSLLFSGGLDSSLLAYYLLELGIDFKAVCVGVKGSKEKERVMRSAKLIGIDVGFYEVEKSDVLRVCEIVSKAIESSDPVKVEASLVIYFASKFSRSRAVFSGLGADELFGGYFRMHRSPALETYWAWKNIYERSTYFTNVSSFLGGAEARVPFLDKEIVKFALSLPEKFRKGKYILRKLAEEKIGEEIARIPKKAAQYSSGISKVIPRPKSKFLSKFWPKNRKIAALISGGKDSWYALHIMHRLNYEISCIVSIKPKREDSWMFHFPHVDFVKKQAEVSNFPIIFEESSGKKEEEVKDLERALRKAVEIYGVEGVVSGAISSSYQRSRIEDVCEKIGLACYSPLWGIDQESYLRRLVKEGFEFVIVSVSAEGLDESWVGKLIGKREVERIIELARRYNFNPAGEGGEYETILVNAPLFKERLNLF